MTLVIILRVLHKPRRSCCSVSISLPEVSNGTGAIHLISGYGCDCRICPGDGKILIPGLRSRKVL